MDEEFFTVTMLDEEIGKPLEFAPIERMHVVPRVGAESKQGTGGFSIPQPPANLWED